MSGQRGQAIVLATFGLVAMTGMAGLAVDLGWAYFVKKQAQTASDAAALAAAEAALASGGSLACGTGVVCQSSTPCASPPINPPRNNLDHGCLYAQANGFTHGGNNGRQSVRIAANVTPPPTAPGVTADYWVTATVAENIPLLFARLFGPAATASARSTAAVVHGTVSGSLLLLNHENDCLPMENTSQLTCGVNLLVSSNDNQSGSAVRADGGIYLASQKNGTSPDGRYAGENTGGGTIRSPFTYIRGNGWYKLTGSSQWTAAPESRSTGDWGDPMRGKGQPRPPVGLASHALVDGKVLGSSDPNNPLLLGAGNYYAVSRTTGLPTGEPITINGYVKFGAGASGFGQYVLFGGVSVAANTTVTFEPGMYVLAGVKQQAGRPGSLFTVTSSSVLRDLTPGYGANTDAGELFVFTDANYSAQGQSLQVPAALAAVAGSLKQGTTGFQSNNANATINLHGLNRSAAALPEDLKEFAPVVLWQDQANSVVKHTVEGEIDTSCGNPDGCANTALASNESPQMSVQGSPTVHYYGTVYQPRGAWTNIVGGGDYEVPIQIIAGAFRVQGNANLSMAQLPSPVTRRIAALVE